MSANIYWAVVRNQTIRANYIEAEQVSPKKWVVLLGDDEFTIKTTSNDFFEVLKLALELKYSREDALPAS